VPATLHVSLMARLDRLGPVAKDVAQKGAVIGREFGYDVLALIASQSQPRLREALDRLTSAGLLFVRGTPPQSSYISNDHARKSSLAAHGGDRADHHTQP